MDGLISIIVPVYKVEAYLRRCLDSIVNQTYRNLEIILVDDGSPDNCPAICDEYAAKDSRVKVIHQKNAGVSAARNAGLDAAIGDYIAFVDSDDWIELDTYEVALSKLSNEKLDIVAFGYFCEFSDWSDVHKMVDENDFIDNIMCCEEPPNVWRYLYRREIFNELRFEIGVLYEDILIIPDIFDRVQRFGLVSKHFYHYNQENIHSIMHLSNRYFEEYVRVRAYQKMIGYCRKHDREEAYKIIVAKTYRLGLRCYIHNMVKRNLSDSERKNLWDIVYKTNSLNCFDKVRIRDRLKYWSIVNFPFAAKMIFYIQKKY